MEGMTMVKEITIFYEKTDQYQLLPVTGAFGGPTPSGDILAEFFVERKTPPTKIVLEIEPPNVTEKEREGERHIREIQVGILIRPDIAHSIGKWLIEKAAQAGFSEVKQ
jgi:hypothetical protein